MSTILPERKKPEQLQTQDILARPVGRTIPSALVVVQGSPPWRTHFCWSRDRGEPGLTVRLFRRAIVWASTSRSVRIHVTADARYRLWLNEEPLGFGPAKGSLGRYHFETYELSGLLKQGLNVLAVEVRWFGENSPASEVHSPVPGLLVQGESDTRFDTPGEWKVWSCKAVAADTTPYIENAHQFLNHLERVELRDLPENWRSGSFDDSVWEQAIPTGPARANDATWGVTPMRTLVPRDIPALTESRHRFTRMVQARAEMENVFASSPKGYVIPVGRGSTILLDTGTYVTAYPEIKFSGGSRREVRVLYAEALGEWKTVGGKVVWQKKGVRDDFTRLDPHGYRDTLILRGGQESWEPFYWRAFRWLQLEILAGDEPVTIEDVTYRLCIHPQKFSAKMAASDAEVSRIFDISVHTLRVGAHEIYDDSPYFEQFSYIADSRLEALGSLHLCNDTSLPRRTLRIFLDTLRADGLLDARAPCQYARQTIPYFCLHWIFMVEDYWRWVGSAEAPFVRECLVAVETILIFFRSRLRPDGFVGPTGGWNMVDMAEEWPHGEPGAVTAGGSTYLTCLYIEALRAAVHLHLAVGLGEDATRWEKLAASLQKKVRETAWDEASGLFVEGVDHRRDRFSQHTQAAAILSDVADRAQQQRILTRLCRDTALIKTNSMQSYYLSRALEKAGQFSEWHAHVLQPWRDALGKGLVTWPEYPDPCRSDSHAWASWPAVDFVASVLGIRPGAPGWTKLRIVPQTDGLQWAEGSAPSPHGPIHVRWEKAGGALKFKAVIPQTLPSEIVLPGGFNRTFSEGGEIDLETTAV